MGRPCITSGASAATATYSRSTSSGPCASTPKRPEVVLVAGATGQGVQDLLAALDRRAATLRGQSAAESSAAEAARLARADAQLSGILAERLRERLRDPAHRDGTQATLRRVAAHEVDPYAAADALLASLGPERPEIS